MPCVWSQISKKMPMKIPCNFQVRTVGSCATVRTGLWRRLDAPQYLEASAWKNVRTSGQHRPYARPSFSNFYTELDFSRHCLGSLCKTSGRHGNTSRHCPAFQTILDFLSECGKELQQRLSWRSAKPSGRGPVMERIRLFWKAITEDRPDETNFPLDAQ
jgi:hypothetical protein